MNICTFEDLICLLHVHTDLCACLSVASSSMHQWAESVQTVIHCVISVWDLERPTAPPAGVCVCVRLYAGHVEWFCQVCTCRLAQSPSGGECIDVTGEWVSYKLYSLFTFLHIS